VIAGDTRLTDGQYGINTRYAPKVWEVGDNVVLTANGYAADGDTLSKRIAQRIEVLLLTTPIPLSPYLFNTFSS
jgi:20S proteasome subunit beta 6